MDYYEELGIERAATKEDISQAHRRLTKLLHPDQQTDEAIKVLADKQMRRLNSIVEVLVDPERRFRYDQHLQFLSATKNSRPTENQFRPIMVPQQRFEWMPSRKSILLSLSSAAVGAILMMCALLLWTNDWGGSTYEERRQLSAEAEGNPTTTASSPATTASAEHSAFDRPPSTLERPPSSPVESNSQQRAAGTSAAPTATTPPPETKPLVAQNTTPRAPATQTSPPPPPPQNTSAVKSPSGTDTKRPASTSPPAADSKKAAADALAKSSSPPAVKAETNTTAAPHTSKNVLEGYWVYNPPKRETSDPGYYVPEFIHLKLSPKGNGLSGNYEARYLGVPKSISPTVKFSVSAQDHQSQKFTWTSTDGSRGTLHVSVLDRDKVRVDWRTTVSSPEQGLTSGVATLIRQNP